MLWLAAVLVFAPSAVAQAAPDGAAHAETLIAEGLELRRAGQDSQAVRKFEEAYSQVPGPRSAAQLGLCLQAVGRWSEAEARLSEALHSKNDAWIAKHRSTLKESLEQVKQNVARVEVNGEPEGASVLINGRNVGSLPLKEDIAVNAGTVDIEVSKPGFKRGYRSLTLKGGQYQRLVMRLEEDPAVHSAAVPAPKFEPLQEAQMGEAHLSTEQSQARRPLYKSPWAWGVVGALVVAGAVTLFLAGNSSEVGSPTESVGEKRRSVSRRGKVGANRCCVPPETSIVPVI